jgi:hypothetical protein
MHRIIVRGSILAALVAAALVPSSAMAAGGGCKLDGDAAFSPGLSNTSQAFTYSFGGALTTCQSDVSGAPASGTVEAGKVVTDAATGEKFQEPLSTGTGGCASSTTKGTAILRWADGTVTVIDYTTSGAAAAVSLSGKVVPSVTLSAINPAAGQPTSMTIATTRYAGSAQGTLAFEADPTQCAGAGVSSAGITGGTLISDMV